METEDQDAKNDEFLPIIIVNGSTTTRSGFAGDNLPKSVFPTVVTKSQVTNDFIVGNDALNKNTDDFKLSYPVEWGIPYKMDDRMEAIYRHTFSNELNIDCTQHAVMVASTSQITTVSMQKLTTMMFETFNCPKFYLCSNARLVSYASGTATAIVVELGHMIKRVVPVYEGYVLPHALRKCIRSGKTTTQFLLHLLNEKGHAFDETIRTQWDIVTDIKEKLCYTAMDYEQELLKVNEIKKQYKLPDGTNITMDVERFKCVEQLFQSSIPKVHGFDGNYMGLHQMINESIQSCDADIRCDLYNNIIIAGGTSLFEGMAQRIYNEMKILAPKSMKVRVIAPPKRKYSVWIGGSILASLSTFEEMWITREQYDEVGAQIVFKKCY